VGCNHFNCEQHQLIDHKHTIFVAAKNAVHRKEVMDALLSFYNILEFDNADLISKALDTIEPGIIILDEDTPPRDGYETARQLHSNPKTKHIPVVLLLSSDTAAKAATAQGHACLVKPYLRSALIKTISGLLNASVEHQWDTLAPVQAKALKGTVEVFNTIADSIASGAPIAYDTVGDACAPLIEAVNSDNFIGIMRGVKNHDNYTYAHSMRVATMLTLFGHAINLPVDEQKILATGGLLHDVGKMSIPHNILNKPGKLNEDEFGVMKSHVKETVRQLELSSQIPKGIITIAGQHHEKLDGTGYPYGLEAGKLNDLARMAAIVDIFSALTDRRVYKPAMSAESAIAIMTDEMARHIDINLLRLFRERFLDALSSVES
jgi:putative nucleotidyltransferase with HDIG domain